MNAGHIGERLKSMRKFFKLRQDEASLKLQVTKQTLIRYEKGHRFPDSQFLGKFCRLFRVDANWLIHGCGDMFIKDPVPDPDETEEGIIQKELKYHVKKTEELVEKLLKIR